MTIFIIWVFLGLFLTLLIKFLEAIDIVSEDASNITLWCYWAFFITIPILIVVGLMSLFEYCQEHKKEIRIFLKIDKMEVKAYNIVKVEKGQFLIEYQPVDSVETKVINKSFKTKPKAEAWVSKNFTF